MIIYWITLFPYVIIYRNITLLVSISRVGCFLIPYLICLVVAGAPILILEVCLGQLASQGGITAWLICPIFQGLFEEFHTF